MTGETTRTNLGSQQSTEKKARSHQQAIEQTTVAYQQIKPSVSDRYQPVQFHARGGVGEVWLAEDSELGRQVAFKRLLRNDQESQLRFFAEAQITGQLEHPSIVPVHDLGIDKSGLPYYVMKFVRGQTLRDAIGAYHGDMRHDESNRILQQQRLLENFIDVCEAVAYAHSNGVIHRDLKPSNIMLGPFGETILLDWGLAKVLDQPEVPGLSMATTSSGRSTETVRGSVIGTPSYMPPEIAEGRSAEAGTSTDIYLLGGTLYEILTDSAPRRGTSRDQILELARSVEPAPPRTINPRIARPLEAICIKAMSKRECDRYESATELAEEVRRYLAGEPVEAYPEPWHARTWRWVKRHHRSLARASIAALVMAIAVGSWYAIKESRERAAVAQRRAVALAAEKKARGEIEAFRRLADQANYQIGFDNADEQFKYYDEHAGLESIDDALALTSHWGDRLEHLPIAEQRDPIRRALYELLLRRAQVRILSSSPKPSDTTLDDLKLASTYAEPTRAFHQLRATHYRLSGNDTAAEADLAAANSDHARVDAFDHFLLGEQFRLAAATRYDFLPGEMPTQRSLQEAIEEYRAALQEDPDHYWSRLQLGRCYLATGQHGPAVEALGACIALRPSAPWAYSARALALARAARYGEAIQDLNYVIQTDPAFLPAMLNRGWVYWKSGKVDQAIADLLRVAEDERRSLPLANLYLGQIYLEKDQLQKALDHFNRFAAARQQAQFWIVHKYLATVRFLTGNNNEGMKHLDLYLQLRSPNLFDPNGADAQLQRGKFLRNLATEDIALLKAQATKQSKAMRIQQLRALEGTILAQAQEQLAAAETSLKTEDVYYELGLVAESLAQRRPTVNAVKQAIAHFSDGLEIQPSSLRCLNKRAKNRRALGQAALAKEDFETATTLQPQNDRDSLALAEAHSWVGILLTEDGKIDQAMRRAARSLAVLFSIDDDPQAYGVLHNVACIYGGVSQLDEDQRTVLEDMAIEVLRRALERARETGVEAREEQYIRAEEEQFFGPQLKSRPDFQALLR